jgi:fimbrial isopeptide formation D2 family protein/uncharacterized repeat protein (TIGR01451 family)
MKRKKKSAIAIVLSLVFVIAIALQMSPLVASALSTDNTGGPATKASYSNTEGGKGSNGFANHNGNGTAGWSSYDDINSALEVHPSYSFKPYIDTSADANGPATVSGYFGSPDQSGFDGAIRDNEVFTGADWTTSSDSTWGFAAKGAGKSAEGTFGVTVSNARMRVSGQMEPVLFDIRVTCTNYVVDDDIWGGYTPFIGIQKNSVSPNITLIGVKEASFKFQYFIPGTNTPYSIHSNLTYSDIDDHQYIAIHGNDAVGGVFLDPATRLNYGFTDNMHMIYAGFDEVSGAGGKAAFGAAFESGGDGLVLTFGNNESSVSASATDGQKKAAFDYAWFGGSAYLMWKPPVPAPFKKVSDGDEPGTDHNTLVDENEYFTYTVNQNLSSGYTSKSYHGSFVMNDQIDPCLDILRVRVRNFSHSSTSTRAEWNSTDGQINDDWFTISVSPGNLVTATAKKSILADEAFYGGSNRIDTIKQLEIRVKWKPGLTNAQKEAHGHRITSPANGFRVPNTGGTIIDGTPRNTGQVITDVFPPDKRVSDSDEGLVINNTLVNANERFHYDILQHVPAKAAADEKYTALNFTDTVESCLEVTDVKILRDGNADVAAQFTNSSSGNSIAVSANAASLADASFYGHTYSVRVEVKPRTNIPESTLRAHGHYIGSDKNLKYVNKASVSVNGRSAIESEPVSTTVPVPDLMISKTANKYEYQASETVHYTVKVSHSAQSNGDAANVHIWDTDIPQDMTISNVRINGVPAPVTGGNVSGITGRVTFRQVIGGFDFTSELLGKSETATITFDVNPQPQKTGTMENHRTAQHPHNGEIIDNTAWVSSFSDTSGDFTNPKLSTATVYINSPVASVNKETDKPEYIKGQAVKYTIRVDNTNVGTYGNAVVIHDKVKTPGIKIQFDGTFVMKYATYDLATGAFIRWNYVTYSELRSQGKITSSGDETEFTINTGLNLGYDTKVPPTDRGRPGYARTDLVLVKEIYVSYETQDIREDFAYDEIVNFVEASFGGKNKNGDNIVNDITIPSGRTEKNHIVPLPDNPDFPALIIKKDVSKPTAVPGERDLYYDLDVTVLNKPVINVRIEDLFDVSAYKASIDLNSIVVKKGSANITGLCTITPKKYEVAAGGEERVKGFVINTNAQLAPGERITVRYRVDLPDTAPELRKLPNTATATAETPDGSEVGPVSDSESVDIITKGTILSLEKLAGRYITKTKADDNDPYYLRQEAPYRIKVTNTTQNPAQNIVIIDVMDHDEMYLDIGSLKVALDIPGGGERDITGSTRFVWGVNDGRFDNAYQSDDSTRDFTLVIDPSISLDTAESIIVTYNAYADYHFEDTDKAAPDFLPEADYVNNVAGAVASNASPLDDESQILVDPHSKLLLEKVAAPGPKGSYVIGDTVPYAIKITVSPDMVNPAVDVGFKDLIVTDDVSIDKGSVRVYFAPDASVVSGPAFEADITDSLKGFEVTGNTIGWESDIILFKGQAIYVVYSADIGHHFTADRIYNVAMGGGFNVPDVTDDFDLLKENDPYDSGGESTPPAIDGGDMTPPGNPTNEVVPVDSKAELKVTKRLRTDKDDKKIAYFLDTASGGAIKKPTPAESFSHYPGPYRQGDIVPYIITVTTVSECPAVDITITDDVATSSTAIVPGSVRIYSAGTGSFADVTDKFKISVGDTNIVAEKWDFLRKGEMLLVTYDLEILEHMTGDTIYNVATAEGFNVPPANDDETVPVDTQTVLKIEKNADKELYRAGDTIYYTLKVTNIGKNNAVNVRISDTRITTGAGVVPDSVKVYFDADGKGRDGWEDITSGCAVSQPTSMTLGIDTGRSLVRGGGEAIWVEYQVRLDDGYAFDDVKNAAKAWADNAPDARTEHIVNVERGVPAPGGPTPDGPAPTGQPETQEPTPAAVKNPVKPTPVAKEPGSKDGGTPAPDKGGKGGVPKTGDDFPIKLIGAIAAAAAAVMFFVSRRYRKLK